MNQYSKLLNLRRGFVGTPDLQPAIKSVCDRQLGTCNWNVNWVGSLVGLHGESTDSRQLVSELNSLCQELENWLVWKSPHICCQNCCEQKNSAFFSNILQYYSIISVRILTLIQSISFIQISPVFLLSICVY